jgi:hypothetical protein
MLLGACDTDWHKQAPQAKRSPLRAVHLYSRTELVWLHARVLYGFLFMPPKRRDDLSIRCFLDGQAAKDWTSKVDLQPKRLCPTVDSECENLGRANKKLFHLTEVRLWDRNGLPDYNKARGELQAALRACYELMVGTKRKEFKTGFTKEWDVATTLKAPTVRVP